MAAREPLWWYHSAPSWQRTMLRPVAWLYGSIVMLRFRQATPYHSRFPVICVGNFTAGGTGKTPMSLLVADFVQATGAEPWFLSRGYGGRLDGQERVDCARHTAAEVGDEPLLLAQRAPTVISRDRRLGAEFIERQAPANAVIIMDDGLQNPALAKDLTIAVVDAERGFGNAAVIPAGPLRAQLAFQLKQTGMIAVNGRSGDRARRQLAEAAATGIPLIAVAPEPRGETGWLKGSRVVAYAGIANPERFYALLGGLGASVTARVSFADHQTMSASEAEKLLTLAAQTGATLVTTEKDFARLAGLDGARAALRARSKTLAIALTISATDREILAAGIAKAIGNRT